MKKLLEEPPLLLLPTLAKALGLNRAIVLQQVHYWLRISGREIEGRKWIYNTYEQWQKQFPFWNKRTIQRIIKTLEEDNILITGNFNKLAIDKTKWYSINYEALMNYLKTKCPDHVDKLSTPLPEITTEKIKYASKVFLVQSEYDSLVEKYGESNTKLIIEKLNNYKEAVNKQYDSDFHAIKLWVADSVLNNKKHGSNYTYKNSNNLLEARDKEIAFTKWIEEGNDPSEFTY